MKKRTHYISKETLAKNILRACHNKNDLRHIDFHIREVYDMNKSLVEKYKNRMNKLDELFYEFTSDPKLFVEKYAKMDNNEYVLKLIEEDPDWHKGLEWL